MPMCLSPEARCRSLPSSACMLCEASEDTHPLYAISQLSQVSRTHADRDT
jgi:hypothetical protein